MGHNEYVALAKQKHESTWRRHERADGSVWSLRSLSYPAYVWARRFLGPFDRKTDVLADLGGGHGNFSFLFRGMVNKIVVVDILREPLQSIKEPWMWRVQGDILRSPLRDSSVTKVILSDVFEHFYVEDLRVLLSEIHRILKTGGTCFVNTSCRGVYLRKYWFRMLGRMGQGELDWADVKDGHLNRLKHKEMVELFESAGFSVCDWRFLKHLFQPLVGIARAGAGCCGWGRCRNRSTWGHREKSIFRWVGKASKFARGISNAWCYLDLVFFGKVPGGAAYYKLVKESPKACINPN